MSSAISLFFFLVVAFSGYFASYSSAVAVAGLTSLNFPSFNPQNLTLHGDSYLMEGIVGLTRAVDVPISSAGAVVYNRPIFLFDPLSNTTSSFSTRFTFFISVVDPGSFGDGFAFFLSPTNNNLGLPGSFLGLVNPSPLSPNKFIAVEFDTRRGSNLNDPSGNHIGLDIDGTISFKTGDSTLQGIDLKSGNLITAWIDYKNYGRNLQVFLSYSDVKPSNPIMRVDDIDLSDHLKGQLYMGFSASTERSTELHRIKNWSFEIPEFHPSRPKSYPLNESGSTGTTIAGIFLENETGKKHRRRLELGVSIAGAAVFCAVLSVVGYISMRKRGTTIETNLVSLPKKFSYKELKSATRGFHSSRIIGSGSFDTVYKAFFSSSGTIASVKRYRQTDKGEAEFQLELSIVAGLRHKNLVQLQGWCVEKGEILLVYDFMPHGSLEDVLYKESEQYDVLSWSHRRNIVLGVASVINYLHQECEEKVIHRGIRTSNILVDGNFNPRLGDFGLEKTLTAGMMGYLAPEYLQYGKATQKSDVFSFGVVVLELACGRRPIEEEGQTMVNIVDWVWGFYLKGNIIEAADKRLRGEFEEGAMRKLLLLGLQCANPDYAERPSMKRVLCILKNEAERPLVPKMEAPDCP